MSYAIIRNANYKKNNLAGLYKHNERKNTNYSNQDINKDNFCNNYSIKKLYTTYTRALKKLQEENNLEGRIIKTTNVVCEFIITSDKDFFESIGIEETKRYFETAYSFVANYNNLGEKYILSAKVHMDESTPHMHLVFVPVVHVKDKQGNNIEKIACSEYWRGKDSYRRLQDNFYTSITNAGFNLERGKSSEREHLSIEKFKELTEYENIKFETEKEPIKELNTDNIEIIVAQNKKLIKDCNKLSGYYIKSAKVIEKYEDLQDENIELNRENKELKEKNHKLNNYIHKIFDVVTNVFKISRNKLLQTIKEYVK